MITIDADSYTAMLDHLQQAAPCEGVGLLAGRKVTCSWDTDGDGNCGRKLCPECGEEPRLWERDCDRWAPLANVDPYPRARYTVGDAELIAAWEALDADDRRPWIVVHSHPSTSAAPSHHDVQHAQDPTLLHMVVSLAGAAPYPVLWRLNGTLPLSQQAVKVRYRVVDLGFQGNLATDLTRDVTSA